MLQLQYLVLGAMERGNDGGRQVLAMDLALGKDDGVGHRRWPLVHAITPLRVLTLTALLWPLGFRRPAARPSRHVARAIDAPTGLASYTGGRSSTGCSATEAKTPAPSTPLGLALPAAQTGMVVGGGAKEVGARGGGSDRGQRRWHESATAAHGEPDVEQA